MKPDSEDNPDEISVDDSFWTLAEHAEPGPQEDGAEPLTNEQIDQILYGNP